MRPTIAQLTFLFSILFVKSWSLQAQSCGLLDTFIVTQNSNTSFNIVIEDYFNNDLSDPMQGLCGVEIGFLHQYVENFELSLTSPAGTTVDLIGPNIQSQFDFTFGTQWVIDFVGCGQTASPDPVFSPQWNNDQTENWGNFGQYTGSYYPFNGCLEDFSQGEVNGIWSINMSSNPSNYQGAVTYVRLVFCDDRGVECCFATGGELLNDNIVACQGADTLLITPSRYFPLGIADTLEYGYGYLISQDGLYTHFDSTLDFTDSLVGTYQVCGFSYRYDELDQLPAPNGSLTVDDLATSLNSLDPFMCADVSENCMDIQILPPPDTTFLTERICAGDTLELAMQQFFETDIFTLNLQSVGGCDSIVVLDLTVEPTPLTILNNTICLGDSATLGSNTYFNTGVYRDTFSTHLLACDSIVELNLEVLAPVQGSLDTAICQGNSLMIGDSVFQQAGNYTIPLQSSRGCDSIVSLNLAVLNPQAVITNAGTIDCNTPSRTLSAAMSSPFNDLSFRWLDQNNQELSAESSLLVTTGGTYTLEVSQSLGNAICTHSQSVFIADNRIAPIADAGADTLITCAHTQIEIGGINTSTGDNFVYQWQGISTGASIVGSVNEATAVVDSMGAYRLIVIDLLNACRDTAFVNVGIDQVAPLVDVGTAFELNCQQTEGILDGSASLTTDFYTAQWTGPCVSPLAEAGTALASCAGEYRLSITNQENGCVAEESLIISANVEAPLALIQTPIDELNCERLSVNLDASASTPVGNLNYWWNAVASPAQIDAQAAGVYQLIVERQDNFCRDTASIEVQQDTIAPQAFIDAVAELNCYEDTAVLGSDLNPAGDHISYQWYDNDIAIPGAIADSLVVNIQGNYSLVLENILNHCTDTARISVSENFLPPPPINAGPHQFLDCNNQVVQLEPDSTLFAMPVSWEWTGPCVLEPTDIWGINVDCPGEYVLSVTNLSNGCSGTAETQVNFSDNYSIAELPDTLYLSCETGMVSIETTNSSLGDRQWYLNGNPIGFTELNPVVDQAGMYTLAIDNPVADCVAKDSVMVLIDCGLEALVVKPDILTCSVQSVTLDASISMGQGPLSYQWTALGDPCIFGPEDATLLEVLCPGDYQLIVSNEIVGEHDTLIVSVLEDRVLPIVDAGDNLIVDCTNTTANLFGQVNNLTDAFTFSWTTFTGDPLGNEQNYSTTTAGTYIFTATNTENDCQTSDIVSVSVDNIPPTIVFGNTAIPCMANSFQLAAFVQPTQGQYNYQWSGPSILSGANDLTANIAQAGIYTFTVTNEQNTCSTTADVEVEQLGCEPCISIATVDTLDCQTASVDITASLCQPCDNCSVSWWHNGDPIPMANALTLNVNEAGAYTIMVNNELLGLSSDTTINVISQVDIPTFSLGDDLNLDCAYDSFTLSAQELNNEEDLIYNWYQIGQATALSNEPTLLVDEAATYYLELYRQSSICAYSDTIVVNIDTLQPIAEAGADRELNCQASAVALNGAGSSVQNVSYKWTGPDVDCISGINSLNPLVTCEGVYYLEVRNEQNACTAMDSVQVASNMTMPTLMPLADTIIDCNHPTVDLTASTPNDGIDYDYRWCQLNEMGEELSFTCEFNLTYTASEAGDYQFTIQNTENACENSFVVSVTTDTITPTIDAGQTATLFCNLDSLTLAATTEDHTTYQWTNANGHPIENANSLNPTIYEAAWYVLTATSELNGCTAVDSVEVLNDTAVPIVAAGPDTLINCYHPVIELQATGQTPSGQALWSWYTIDGQIDYGQSSSTAAVSASAWYYVRLEDPMSECFTLDSVWVNQDFRAVEALLEDADNLLLNCFTDTLLLDASPAWAESGAPLIYEWTTTTGNLFENTNEVTIFTDSPAAYQLTVEDSNNGCRDTLDFNVMADFTTPTIELAGVDTITCAQSSVVLNAIAPNDIDNHNFEWLNANNELLGAEPSVGVDQSGVYTIRVQNQINGCSASQNINVTSDTLKPTIVIANPLDLNCARTVVQLDGSASSTGNQFHQQWSSPSASVLLGSGQALIDSTSQEGAYQLYIQNQLTGCADSSSVFVLNTDNQITALDVSVVSPACAGDQYGSISVDEVIGGTPNFSYSLNGGQQGLISFFDDLATGSYELMVEDAQGCYYLDTLHIYPAIEFSVDLGPDHEILLGDSVQLLPEFSPSQVVDSFHWNPIELIADPNNLTPYVKPVKTTFIELLAYDDNDCPARDTVLIKLLNRRPYFIPSAFSPNGDGDNDKVSVFAGDDVVEVKVFQIFDRWGNMVFDAKNFAPNNVDKGWDGTLDGKDLNAAVFVYYVELLYIDGWLEKQTGDIMLMR